MKTGCEDLKLLLINKSNKRGGLVRLLSSIILGFIPSFIFIYLFVQYGSPFSNYVKFLSNLNNSWWAWVTALILIILFYSIFSLIKSREKIKTASTNRYFLIGIILLFIIVIILVGAQLYLYTTFLLGNDLLVKLSSDKDNLIFANGQPENVTFKISVTMNPFCKAECHYDFFDISNGNIIESGDFNLASIFPEYKNYIFNKGETTHSQDINRFQVSCKSTKTILCYTKGEESQRSVLITLNYNLDPEQNTFKNDSKLEIISLAENLSIINEKINESELNIDSINNSFLTENFSQESAHLLNEFSDNNNSLERLIELWKLKSFQELKGGLIDLENKTQNLYLDSNKLQENLKSNITFYNILTENFSYLRQTLKDISQYNLTNESCISLNEEIDDFNLSIQEFSKNLKLTDKKNIVNKISSEINNLYKNSASDYENPNSGLCIIKFINEKSFTNITIFNLNESLSAISLEEPINICCFYGKCDNCCDSNCSQKNYPVIFLHGHSINKALAADYSLDAFVKIKENLSNEGYIDAGAIVISPIIEQQGLWGRVNAPVEVTASYYFDVYKTDSGEMTVPSKTDSIDTYAIRLKDIISLVKYRTNKDKVIIVAHSMGGLVTRRYADVFGGTDIEKAILIDTPNHGIDDKVKNYCSLLGPEAACSDMDKNSIFINKLNNAETPKFPVYNIIGVGCNMGGETGDGIVKNSSQYLDFATNYYISGSCNELSFDFLHEDILDPKMYPQVLDIIKNVLSNQSS